MCFGVVGELLLYVPLMHFNQPPSNFKLSGFVAVERCNVLLLKGYVAPLPGEWKHKELWFMRVL